MNRPGRAVAAAALVALLAGAAAPEPAAPVLSWAEGPGEDGARVRMFVGEIDGRGVAYAEHYAGDRLASVAPYLEVYVDDEPASSVRALRHLEMVGPTADGFAFTADEARGRLKCTALLFADATINCTRDTFRPAGAPSCARYLKSHLQRFQCNGLRALLTSPAVPYDEMLATCAASFRKEGHIMSCMRDAYSGAPASLFRETLAACLAAYQAEDAREHCLYYSFESAPRRRPSVEDVRACQGAGDDQAVSDCVFQRHTGVKQVHPKRTPSPANRPTEPVAANPAPAKARLSGGRIEVSSSTWRDVSRRATGGMVESEPVLWVDTARDGSQASTWPVDRLIVGGQVRALREVSALDRIALNGLTLTFRVVLGGKRLACRVDGSEVFARCQ